jgi:hypothetical protein
MSYNARYFRLRYLEGFTDEMVSLIAEGYEEWKQIVRSAIAEWNTHGIRDTQPPDYIFGDVGLSVDRTVVSIKIEGDPHSYGALKLFEDGVPRRLFKKLPIEVLERTEMAYENLAMNHPERWLPTDYRFG